MLSHQFPVLVVVAETVVAVDVVEVCVVGVVAVVDVVVDIVVAVVGEVVVDVVVELLQDANSNDVTNRKDIDAKIMPFFIETSF